MSDCCEPVLYIRCGTTTPISFRYRDAETKEPITIDDFTARGSILDQRDNVVLALTTQLSVPVGEARVVLQLSEAESKSLSPQNERLELQLYIELVNGSDIQEFWDGPLIVKPDLTP